MSSEKNRRIAIVGIGGMGGYFGARLLSRYASDDKVEIVFFQRGEHLDKIKKDGLRYITQNNEYHVFPDIITDGADQTGIFNIVIVCVKGYDLTESAELYKNNLNNESIVIPILNGVHVAEQLEAYLPKCHILPGCIYVSAKIERPGVVRQVSGAGEFCFGPEGGHIESYRQLELFFQDAKIKASLVPDINYKLWEKFIFVGSIASVTTYLDVTSGALLENSEWLALVSQMILEIKAVAFCEGVTFTDTVVESILDRLRLMPYETKSSLHNDFELGRKTELENLTGCIVRLGKKYGMSTPCHDRIYLELFSRLN